MYLISQAGRRQPCQPRQVRKEAAATVVAGCPALGSGRIGRLLFANSSMQTRLRQIQAIVGQENLFTDSASLIAYASSANFGGPSSSMCLPMAIARPRHFSQAGKLLKFCASEGIAVLIRGGGTAFLRQPSINSGTLIILTTGMDRIIEIDQQNRLAHVQAGVTCAALRKAAEQMGLFYPQNPASAIICTIGGNVAMNACGSATVKYGPTVNWVEKLEVFLANGEFLTCSNHTSQLVSGFPLAPLFCGSAGCLGLIGGCSLRLLPLPEANLNAIFQFSDELSACHAASAIMASNLVPCELEFYDGVSAGVLLQRPGWNKALLSVGFQDSTAAATAGMAEAKHIIGRAGGVQEDNLPQPHAGGLLPDLAHRAGHFFLETLISPPAHVARLVEGARAIASEYRLTAAIFGHAGVGSLTACFFINGPQAPIGEIRKKLLTLQLMLNNWLQSEAEADSGLPAWQQNQPIRKISASLRAMLDPGQILSGQPLPNEKS